MSQIRFDGKTAIVTGGGGGLGSAHAKLLASRGANVVVNDLGGDVTGHGKGSSMADKVVAEIRAAGGQAVASYDSVSDMAGAQAIVEQAKRAFGGVHILINNAGILRDTSFKNLGEDDWDAVFRVHVKGAFCMSKAVWEDFREQNFGRIVMTSSAAGLYGNFGQANYSAAKMALVGFGQTLALEGAKNNVLTNVICPVAASRMTATILPPEQLAKLNPASVSAFAAYLCSAESKESGGVFEVGAGRYFHLKWGRSPGYRSPAPDGCPSVEEIREHFAQIKDLSQPQIIRGIAESLESFMS